MKAAASGLNRHTAATACSAILCAQLRDWGIGEDMEPHELSSQTEAVLIDECHMVDNLNPMAITLRKRLGDMPRARVVGFTSVHLYVDSMWDGARVIEPLADKMIIESVR